jgi:ubiquinone/menaquinone biosynthesis C-methylase UbiE
MSQFWRNMRSQNSSQQSLAFFFDERAARLSETPDVADLCYVSGREPRIWTRAEVYEDLLSSVADQLEMTINHKLLEVGCAAGYLARGLAMRCAEYTGVDLSPEAIDRARKLGVANAAYLVGDATALPFADNTFDRALCYEVFTNLNEFDLGCRIIREMARVVKPHGKLMIGSVPDAALKTEYEKRAREVTAELNKQSPVASPAPRARPALLTRLRHWYLRTIRRIEPRVICYYFRKEEFITFGKDAGLVTAIHEIHPQNPYHGYRFNVLMNKVSAAAKAA